MPVDIAKYQKKGKSGDPAKVHLAFAKGEEGYELIVKLRGMGIGGSHLKDLMTDLLREAVVPVEKKPEVKKE